MRPDIGLLLPPRRNAYAGPALAVWFLVLINTIETARSLVHILAQDSGAQSIATMDVTVAGGDNIVALLAQWGGAQLLMACLIWVVLARYRVLVPLMLAGVLLEQVLRIGIGLMKPLDTIGTAPGSIASKALLPVIAVMLAVSLLRRRDPAADAAPSPATPSMLTRGGRRPRALEVKCRLDR